MSKKFQRPTATPSQPDRPFTAVTQAQGSVSKPSSTTATPLQQDIPFSAVIQAQGSATKPSSMHKKKKASRKQSREQNLHQTRPSFDSPSATTKVLTSNPIESLSFESSVVNGPTGSISSNSYTGKGSSGPSTKASSFESTNGKAPSTDMASEMREKISNLCKKVSPAKFVLPSRKESSNSAKGPPRSSPPRTMSGRTDNTAVTEDSPIVMSPKRTSSKRTSPKPKDTRKVQKHARKKSSSKTTAQNLKTPVQSVVPALNDESQFPALGSPKPPGVARRRRDASFVQAVSERADVQAARRDSSATILASSSEKVEPNDP